MLDLLVEFLPRLRGFFRRLLDRIACIDALQGIADALARGNLAVDVVDGLAAGAVGGGDDALLFEALDGRGFDLGLGLAVGFKLGLGLDGGFFQRLDGTQALVRLLAQLVVPFLLNLRPLFRTGRRLFLGDDALVQGARDGIVGMLRTGEKLGVLLLARRELFNGGRFELCHRKPLVERLDEVGVFVARLLDRRSAIVADLQRTLQRIGLLAPGLGVDFRRLDLLLLRCFRSRRNQRQDFLIPLCNVSRQLLARTILLTGIEKFQQLEIGLVKGVHESLVKHRQRRQRSTQADHGGFHNPALLRRQCHRARNLQQVRHDVVRQRQAEHLAGHRQLAQAIVERIRLRRQCRHRRSVFLAFLGGVVEPFAAHVQHGDHFHARLAEQLRRQRGFLDAIRHLREQIRDLAHRAVGILGRDPGRRQRLAVFEQVLRQPLDATADGFQAGAGLVGRQLVAGQRLDGDADLLG